SIEPGAWLPPLRGFSCYRCINDKVASVADDGIFNVSAAGAEVLSPARECRESRRYDVSPAGTAETLQRQQLKHRIICCETREFLHRRFCLHGKISLHRSAKP